MAHKIMHILFKAHSRLRNNIWTDRK